MSKVKVAPPKNSIRAQSKASDPFATKAVFRPVLNNPLTIAWPSLSSNIRNQILEALIEFLSANSETEQSIEEWRLREHARKRGRTVNSGKEKEKDSEPKKKRSRKSKSKGRTETENESKEEKVAEVVDIIMEEGENLIDSDSIIATHPVTTRSSSTYAIPNTIDRVILPNPNKIPKPKPVLLNFITTGINSVTKALETRIRWGRWELGDPRAIPLPSTNSATVPKPKKPVRRSKNHLRTKRLSLFEPTSAATLARPSYQFLSRPPVKEELPGYLIKPTETLPFFKLLAQSNEKTKIAVEPFTSKQMIENRANLLGTVMKEDDPKAAVLVKKVERKRKKVQKITTTPTAVISEGVEEKLEEVDGEEAVEEEEVDWLSILDIIFVCKPDINPPSLVEHLPLMIAANNGIITALDSLTQPPLPASEEEGSKLKRPNQKVLLITLDVGAEAKLAKVLALRRVAVLGISSQAPNIAPLLALLSSLSLKPLSTPWLIPHLTSLSNVASTTNTTSLERVELLPTKIKHLRSTAPVDPKGRLGRIKELKEVRKGGVYVAED